MGFHLDSRLVLPVHLCAPAPGRAFVLIIVVLFGIL